MNEDVMARTREYKKNLVITGFGFMAIELWDIIKFVVEFVLEGGAKELIGETELNEFLVEIMFYVFIFTFFAIITLFHTYIGMSAVKYGTDRSRKKGFLIWAGIYGILTGLQFPELISNLITQIKSEDAINTVDTAIASIIVELTLFFILFDMIYYAIRLARIEKKYA